LNGCEGDRFGSKNNTVKGEKTMSKKEAYEKKIEAQLKEWKTDIDKMKAKAEKADAEAKLEYYKQIEELRTRQEAAQKKLTELKGTGEEAWEDLKVGIELAWTSLGEAVKSARSRFK
jgi:dGTP triphosphohydrolase